MMWLALFVNLAFATDWKAGLGAETVHVIAEGHPAKYKVIATRGGRDRDLHLSYTRIKAITDAIDTLTLTRAAGACEAGLTLESPFGGTRVCDPDHSDDRRVRTLLGDLRR